MTEISRKDLYDKIWSTPMQTVAKEFGLSDRGLAKICEKYLIPRPPRGYWAKLEHGYLVKQQALPKRAIPDDQIIKIASPTLRFHRPQVSPTICSPVPEVQIPARLTRPHPITQQCRALLKNGQLDEYGRLRVIPRPPIKVGKAILPRTLRLLDAILKTCTALGYKSTYDRDKGNICISVENESIGLIIEERVRRTDAPKPNNPNRWFYPRFQYHLTGELIIRISARFLYGVRQQWKDTSTRTLESQLPKLIASLQVTAAVVRQGKAEEKAREERWRLERQRAERAQRRKGLLDQRCKRIEEDLENWSKAQQLRDYLRKVEESDVPEVQRRRLVRWGWRYADHLDPLVSFRIDGFDTANDPRWALGNLKY